MLLLVAFATKSSVGLVSVPPSKPTSPRLKVKVLPIKVNCPRRIAKRPFGCGAFAVPSRWIFPYISASRPRPRTKISSVASIVRSTPMSGPAAGGGGGGAPGTRTSSTAIVAGMCSGIRISARRMWMLPAAAKRWWASPCSVRFESSVTVIRSLDSGRALRAVRVRSIGSSACSTPMLPRMSIRPGPAWASSRSIRNRSPSDCTDAVRSDRRKPIA